MRVIFEKERCVICHEPAEFCLSSKPKETPGYFTSQWFCKKHFHDFVNLLREADIYNAQKAHIRGEMQ